MPLELVVQRECMRAVESSAPVCMLFNIPVFRHRFHKSLYYTEWSGWFRLAGVCLSSAGTWTDFLPTACICKYILKPNTAGSYLWPGELNVSKPCPPQWKRENVYAGLRWLPLLRFTYLLPHSACCGLITCGRLNHLAER